jgi:glutamyl-tRNA reductase
MATEIITGEQSVLFAIGANHNTAPLEIRERIYVHDDEIPALVRLLKETLEEVVVLSTCNRTEIYGVTKRTDVGLDHYKDLLIDFKGANGHVSRDHFFGAVSCAACLQLFRVATSLDSRVVGDTQILGQIRSAYTLAKHNQSTGKIVNQLFQRSFKLGKRARSETVLHKGAISVSVAAADYVGRHFRTLANRTVLLIGAGATASLAAEALVKRGVGKLIVANRTPETAQELLSRTKCDGEGISLNEIRGRIAEVDAVISSVTTEDPIVRSEDLVRRKAELLLVDLGVPRNMTANVGELPGVHLKNVDELTEIVDANYRRRLDDVPLARAMIKEEMTDFLVWYYSLPLLPAAMPCGSRPDAETLKEIVGVKEFLFANLSWVHKLALNDGGETFAGHASVVNRLVEMRASAAAAGQ